MLSENFGFRLSHQEKVLLKRLARQEERTPADILRRLIYAEAQARSLWVPDDSQDEQGEEVQHD